MSKSLSPRLRLRNILHKPAVNLDFVLPGLLAGTVGQIYAAGGTGKSIYALEAAIAVAGGPDLLCLHPAQTGPVLFIAAEDPLPVLEARIQALQHLISEAETEKLEQFLDITPALASGIDLFSKEDAGVWEATLAKRAENCRLIIIDTLSRVQSGNENAREDAAIVMRRLERIAASTGAAIIVLHHVGKSSVMNGNADLQQASRGASVWIDESRWAAFLRVMDEKEAATMSVDIADRREYVRFGVSKANYSPPFADVWLHRQENGVLLPAEMSAETGKTHSKPMYRGKNHIARSKKQPKGKPLLDPPSLGLVFDLIKNGGGVHGTNW